MNPNINTKQLEGTAANCDLLRLRDILAPRGPIPVSRSTWFSYVASGHAPQPVKLGPRITAYRRSEIEAFINDPFGWSAHK